MTAKEFSKKMRDLMDEWQMSKTMTSAEYAARAKVILNEYDQFNAKQSCDKQQESHNGNGD
jgi:hypothetical protein